MKLKNDPNLFEKILIIIAIIGVVFVLTFKPTCQNKYSDNCPNYWGQEY